MCGVDAFGSLASAGTGSGSYQLYVDAVATLRRFTWVEYQ